MATHDQAVLAKVLTAQIIERASRIERRPPHTQLTDSLEEAIRDARAGCSVLEEADMTDCTEYLLLCSRVARWEAALRINR